MTIDHFLWLTEKNKWFLNWIAFFWFLLLLVVVACRTSLYIPDIGPLPITQIAKFFSHSMGGLFTLWITFYCAKLTFWWNTVCLMEWLRIFKIKRKEGKTVKKKKTNRNEFCVCPWADDILCSGEAPAESGGWELEPTYTVSSPSKKPTHSWAREWACVGGEGLHCGSGVSLSSVKGVWWAGSKAGSSLLGKQRVPLSASFSVGQMSASRNRV